MSRLSAFGFSGALLVAQGGAVVLSKGYGLANRSERIPVDQDTVFTVGSITKQFTAAAVLKLEMQERLAVGDSISKYFEDCPPDKEQITLHHLLTHTAGLESDYGSTDFEPVTREELVKRVLAAPLRTAPGAVFHYSNAGYSLLAAIVEKISGVSYEGYLSENLWKPAGMFDTGYRLPQWKKARIARGYVQEEEWGTILERPWAADGPYWNLRGNGGVHSTVEDMYRWHQALDGEGILSKEAKAKYYKPWAAEGPEGRSHYGYGWSIVESPHGKLITHNGGNGVFFADFLRYIDAGVTIYIASNTAEWKATALSALIAGIVFGKEYTAPPKSTRIERALLEKYAGIYSLPSGARLVASAGENCLRFEADGQAATEMLWSAGVGPADRARSRELGERSQAMIARAAEGDYELLKEAFRGRIPADRIEAMEGEMWGEWKDRHGPFQSVRVLGVTLNEEGDAHALMRLQFERGAVFLSYVWGPRRLLGIRPVASPSKSVFVPQSETEFAGFDLDRLQTVRLRFLLDAKGAVAGVERPDDSTLTARRTE
jgi:CubicO group peptidase (beta-lactamase class C family)